MWIWGDRLYVFYYIYVYVYWEIVSCVKKSFYSGFEKKVLSLIFYGNVMDLFMFISLIRFLFSLVLFSFFIVFFKFFFVVNFKVLKS